MEKGDLLMWPHWEEGQGDPSKLLKSFFRVMKWGQSSNRGLRMCMSKQSAQAVVPPTINHFHVWFSVSSCRTEWKLLQGDKFLLWLVLFLSPAMRCLGKRPISLGSIFVVVRLKDTKCFVKYHNLCQATYKMIIEVNKYFK